MFLLALFLLSQCFEGHSDFINDLVFDPKEGQEIASVSDDHTCRYIANARSTFLNFYFVVIRTAFQKLEENVTFVFRFICF